MKSLTQVINEEKNIFSEVQYEVTKGAAYSTINIGDAKNKYKCGFLTYNENDEFITITVCNSLKDLVEMFGSEKDAYDDVARVKVGETKGITVNGNREVWTRIW